VANINNLANEIARELQRYTNLVTEEVEVAKDEVAKDLVSELKQTSPKETGSYRKGWRIKRERNKLIVHNKTNYQLTHLLEHGHAKAGGGRVPAKVHIRPAEEKAVADYLDRVERAIRQ
jgi:hypothetical protein